MKKRLIVFLIWVTSASVAVASINAQEPVKSQPKAEPTQAYLFTSGAVIGFINDKAYPATRVSEKHIFLDVKGKQRKVKMNSPIGLGLKKSISDKLVQVTESQVSFSNQSAARTELRLLSELAYSQSANDTEITDVRDFYGGSQPNTEILYQEEGYRDRIENQIDEGRMHEDTIADTVQVKLTLNPTEDLDGAYLVVGVSYDLPNTLSKAKKRGSRMAVHYLGDLEAGVPKRFEFRKRFSPFYPRNNRNEIFLFEGNAEPIAHTLSKGLQALTAEQAEELSKHLSDS